MVTLTNLAETASLLGDPARAAMLFAMLDGRAFAAGELARVAGISAPTASGHLTKLCAAGMLAVERQGRHRYFRLASPEIGAALEGLLTVTQHRTASRDVRLARPGPRDAALRRARVCYDHLAGELGVALFTAMVGNGSLSLAPDGVSLTDEGRRFLAENGIVDGAALSPKAATCRPCLDWSERRHHLAGAVGRMLLTSALDRAWLRRLPDTRALAVTVTGQAAFRRAFGVTLAA
jgi:DNA-binding transcriptional ArsR family regulator